MVLNCWQLVIFIIGSCLWPLMILMQIWTKKSFVMWLLKKAVPRSNSDHCNHLDFQSKRFALQTSAIQFVVCLVFLGFSACRHKMNDSLLVNIEWRSPHHKQLSSKETSLLLKVKNHSDQDIQVLKWLIGLPELQHDIFIIKRNGKKIPYEGPKIKRLEPSVDDFERISPGKGFESHIDLSLGYDVRKPGIYEVKYQKSFIHKVDFRLEKSKEIVQQEPFLLESNTLKWTVEY